MKQFKDFTDEERKEFWDHFGYQDDVDSPAPWGAPWEYAPDMTCPGDTIKEISEWWYNKMKDEIEEEVRKISE